MKTNEQILRDALDIALDLANAEVENLMAALGDRRPHRHAAAARDVQAIKDAIAALAATEASDTEQGAAAPMAYADPMAFLNFASGVAVKEWMWAKPDNGLVPLYTHPATSQGADQVRDAGRLSHIERKHVMGSSYRGITSLNIIVHGDDCAKGGALYAIDCMVEREAGRAPAAPESAEASADKLDAARWRALRCNWSCNYDRKDKEFSFFYDNRGELSGSAKSYNDIPDLETIVDRLATSSDAKGEKA